MIYQIFDPIKKLVDYCLENCVQNMQKKYLSEHLFPSKHASKLEKCSFEENEFKHKLIGLIELSGYTLAASNSKIISDINLKF